MNVITVDAAGSERLFAFDHRPVGLDTIKVWKPDGTPGETLNGATGRLRTVFDVKLDQPGTYKIGSQQTMVTGSLMLNGVERRVGGRGGPPPGANGPQNGTVGGTPGGAPTGAGGLPPGGSGPGQGPGGPGGPGAPRRLPPIPLAEIPADATDVKLTEIINTLETFVSVGDPSATVLKPVGKGLELEPITHPNNLAAGETARFRFLIDGKPAPGVQVTVIQGGDRYRNNADANVLTTGADGIVAIKWPAAGMYWVGAAATDTHAAEPRAQQRRMGYVATLEVMTP
jgi:hypothetical protein